MLRAYCVHQKEMGEGKQRGDGQRSFLPNEALTTYVVMRGFPNSKTECDACFFFFFFLVARPVSVFMTGSYGFGPELVKPFEAMD